MNHSAYSQRLLRTLILPLAYLAISPTALAEKPATPFLSPFLAKSSVPISHAASDFTPLPGPIGSGRRLKPDEIQWKPLGPVNSFIPVYSAPYPNGKRVMWAGGYDRVTKLDADTLDVLSTFALGGNTYFGDEEIHRHIATMDKLDDHGLIDYSLKLWKEPFRHAASCYHLLSSDGEFYLPRLAPDGSIALRVYGDDGKDSASPIELRREWAIPAEVSKAPIFGMNMTADGWIVMITMDGVVMAVSRDLKQHHILKLPRRTQTANKQGNKDLFSSFVRNSLAADDQNGIYAVTSDYMHRVQWTGEKLSLDEADGGWSAPYPNDSGLGSGTTPGLIGWGPKEDHLVMIADGTRSGGGNNALVFWRDKIPDDWKGLPGLDRRIAGITPIRFGVKKDEKIQIENAPVVYGNGAFFNNTFPENPMPDQGSPTAQWFAESFSMHVPGHEAKGGAMIRWDAKARELKTAWQTQTNFASTVCTVSGATETVYCWGARNREWTLEGTDWNTGRGFHYTLGKSQRYNPLGGFMLVAPNGAIDCGCAGGLGLVRVKPGNSGSKKITGNRVRR